MSRINLYNYRAKEIYFRKLRIYFLLASSVLLAIILNVIFYGYLQIEILHQQTRNSFLVTHLEILNTKLAPINEFNNKLRLLQEKVNLVNSIEQKRGYMVGVFQSIDRIVPRRVYFNSISIANNHIEFSGVAAGPVFIADFIDQLRESKNYFKYPALKTNSTNDRNIYNFAIGADIDEAAIKPELDKNG